jgi:hypothetical protein
LNLFTNCADFLVNETFPSPPRSSYNCTMISLPNVAGVMVGFGVMRLRSLSLCIGMWGVALVAAVAGTASPAKAAMRIAEDRGGQIGQYLQSFAVLRSSGESVVIDGNCLSACTLVLGLIPHNRICATPRARFGFHAAWMPDVDGQPVTSRLGTQALWNIYPSRVKRWISRHGGLSRKMIYMQGRDLRGIVAYCGQKTEQASVGSKNRSARRADARSHARAHARSERRYSRRTVRYTTASAANDRR